MFFRHSHTSLTEHSPHQSHKSHKFDIYKSQNTQALIQTILPHAAKHPEGDTQLYHMINIENNLWSIQDANDIRVGQSCCPQAQFVSMHLASHIDHPLHPIKSLHNLCYMYNTNRKPVHSGSN